MTTPAESKLRRSRKSRLTRLAVRILRYDSSPRRLARGCAIGIFWAAIPITGQMPMALLCAWFLRGNKLAAATCTWISNPLTYLPFFAFNYGIGVWIVPGSAWQGDAIASLIAHFSMESLWKIGKDLAVPLYIGSVLVGMITSLATYFLVLHFLRRRKRRRESRLVTPRLHTGSASGNRRAT